MDAHLCASLNKAAISGHTRCIQVLLQNGANVNEMYDGRMPLHWAVDYGHSECIKILLQHGANIDQRIGDLRWTALYLAIYRNNHECVKVLLDSGADITIQDKIGNTAMYRATPGMRTFIEDHLATPIKEPVYD